MLLPILAALAAPPEHLGAVGSSRFWHEHQVQDVHVRGDGTLLSFAGCAVHRWSAAGELLEATALEGCTPGLNDGYFSPDGLWIAASGLWTGEQGLWRVTGGKPVHVVESLYNARFCAGALWDVDGARGFRRLDLETGEVDHPSGDHGTGFLCVGDAWMLDEHGHRIDPDGTVVELRDPGDSRAVVGATDDEAFVYLYEQRLVRVDHEGQLSPSLPVPDVPERVVALGDEVLYLEDGVDDVAWRIGAGGRIVGGPWFAEGQGLGARRGMGALFLWNGVPWSWGGRRIFPLEEASGPVDTTNERFFLDEDELYLCRGGGCEVRRLDALDGPVRMLRLPDTFNDEAKLSPTHRFLGMHDTRQLFRVELDTGEVEVQPVPEWVDGLSIDARGHFRWRLSEDEDDDDVYVTRVYDRQDGQDVVLGTWREAWLSDPGWNVLQLGPTLRYTGGRTTGHDDADTWHETPDGHAFLVTGYGSVVEVYDPEGNRVQHRTMRIDQLGPWALGDMAVEGAGSPDGRHFAARGPDGTVHVWRVGAGIPLPPAPPPEPLSPFAHDLAVGTQLGAPAVAVEAASLFPEGWLDEVPAGVTMKHLELLGYLEEPTQLLVSMASFAPRTQPERLAQLETIQELSSGWDEEDLYALKGRWVALQRGGTFYDLDRGEDRVPDAGAVAADLSRLVKRHRAGKVVDAHRAWLATQPLPDAPAFGLEACHALATEPGLTPPQPSAEAASERPRALQDAIVVAVAADGTPSWVGSIDDTRSRAGRACWQKHDQPWTPATRDGVPEAMCVVVPCYEPRPPEE